MKHAIIIRKPIITEKANHLKEQQNTYLFEVEKGCNKLEIKKAIEELFNVTVLDVRTYMTHGKLRTRGKYHGWKPDWKRAIVKLKDGDTIEYFEGA